MNSAGHANPLDDEEDDLHYINSSRGGHQAPANKEVQSSMRSQESSIVTSSRDGPPREYEEIIQTLEGEVRKHIRIE